MSHRGYPWLLWLVGFGHSACWPVDGTASNDAGGRQDGDVGGQDSGPESACDERATIGIDPTGGPVYTYLEAYPGEPTKALADGQPPSDSVTWVVDPGVTVVVVVQEDGSACARNQWDLGCGERVEWEVDSFPLEFIDDACAPE